MENQRMINAAFVAQSCADTQQKLQKLEGFTVMNATQLLEVANKVFVNQDHEVQWEVGKKNETESSPASSSIEELRSSETDSSLVESGN